MSASTEASDGLFAGRERRRNPRYDVLGQLNVHVVTQPMMVTVREISAGGFSIETTEPIPVGIVHRFHFYFDDEGAAVGVDAKSVYSMRISSATKLPQFFTGFEFGPLAPEVKNALTDLVAEITAFSNDPL